MLEKMRKCTVENVEKDFKEECFDIKIKSGPSMFQGHCRTDCTYNSLIMIIAKSLAKYQKSLRQRRLFVYYFIGAKTMSHKAVEG